MILDVWEMLQFNALKKKAAKYRPYDGTLTVTERSATFSVLRLQLIISLEASNYVLRGF